MHYCCSCFVSLQIFNWKMPGVSNNKTHFYTCGIRTRTNTVLNRVLYHWANVSFVCCLCLSVKTLIACQNLPNMNTAGCCLRLQSTIFLWLQNKVGYCCSCFCELTIPSQVVKIMEKKLRTPRFRRFVRSFLLFYWVFRANCFSIRSRICWTIVSGSNTFRTDPKESIRIRISVSSPYLYQSVIR